MTAVAIARLVRRRISVIHAAAAFAAAVGGSALLAVVRPPGALLPVLCAGVVLPTLTLLLLKARQDARERALLLARQNALRDTEERFRLFMDNAPAHSWIKDERGRYVYVNHRFQQSVGRPASQIIGATDHDLYPASATEEWRERDRRVLQGTARPQDAEEVADEHGAIRHFWTSRFEIKDVEGRRYTAGSALDITELRQAQARIQRLHRLYEVLSGIAEAVIGLREEEGLYQEVCRIGVELGGLRMAWIGVADAVTGQLELAACAGAQDPAHAERLRDAMRDDRYGEGPSRRAMREGRHVICNDIASGGRMGLWRDSSAPIGDGACAAFPIRVGGQWRAVLSLASTQQGFFDDEEVALLDRLAAHVGFALEAIESERHRKRAEAQLRDSERHYRDLVDSIPGGVFRSHWDDAGNIHYDYISPRLGELLGVDGQAMVANPAVAGELMHPDDRPRLEQQVNESRMNGLPLVWEGRHWRDGQWRWLRVECLSSDTVRTGLITDVTERRNAEEQLRLYAAAVASTQDNVIVTDPDHRIVLANPAFLSSCGLAQSEVLGRTPMELRVMELDDPQATAGIANEVATSGAWRGRMKLRCKDGRRLMHWISANPLYDSQGRITHYVTVSSDISQLEESQQRLQQLAHYDLLTGLPNRLLVQLQLEQAIGTAARQGQQIALLFIDLDHFKTINDSLGHTVGDQVLIAAAQRLSGCATRADALGRLGGDEFLLRLEDLQHPGEAAVVAETLLRCLEAPLLLPGGQEVCLHASIGISLYPRDGTTVDQLVRNADAAMYRAKAQGRNHFSFYTEELTRAASERLTVEQELRHALEHNELRVHYQPLISVADGRIVGAEALVRWPRAGRPLTPDQFIPLAEETGLIVPLGLWMLRNACAQARRWMDAGFVLPTLALNVSAVQFRREDFSGQLRALLQETGLPPGMLELELTESGLMDRGPQDLEVLHELKTTGVRLAVDDFGTGYSSLAYLTRLPIDKLKIDRRFISRIPAPPGDAAHDAAIAATIIGMAHTLGLEVLAEGVETQAQLEFLRRQGCTLCQGFLFSPAVPAEVFERQFLEPQNRRVLQVA